MLDINYVRENREKVREFSKNKGCEVDVDKTLALDERRRELEGAINPLREERNSLAKNKKPDAATIARGKEIKAEVAALEDELAAVEAEFTNLLKQIPNAPSDDVPVGLSEDENVVVEVVGEVPKLDFEAKNHWQIAEARGWIDKERATKVVGTRFAYIKGDLVKLQMAMVSWVMNLLTDQAKIREIIKRYELGEVSDKPFTPVLPPLMLKTEIYDAMDRLGDGEERYKIEGDDLWLQGSAEHVLGPMYANEIIDEAELPIRYLGYATSFRREAGTYGKDMEGIIRMHQFDKLELESFTTAEAGMDEHLFFIAVQRYMLDELKLPYQVLQKCTWDIGKPNARGVDLEVWLPGQGKYRETHTADYMTDYQTRRLKMRVRRASGEIELTHTNDATAFALGRIMIALIENGQTADGKVKLPEVLVLVMGVDTI